MAEIRITTDTLRQKGECAEGLLEWEAAFPGGVLAGEWDETALLLFLGSEFGRKWGLRAIQSGYFPEVELRCAAEMGLPTIAISRSSGKEFLQTLEAQVGTLLARLNVPPPVPGPVSPQQKAAAFLASPVKYFWHGFEMTAHEVVHERRLDCQVCPKRLDSRCAMVSDEIELLISDPDVGCPIGTWPAVIRDPSAGCSGCEKGGAAKDGDRTGL